MSQNNIDLTEEQAKVLQLAVEFYIRLGLGRFSELFVHFSLLQGDRLSVETMDKIRNLSYEIEELVFGESDKNWDLKDDKVSLYTMTAFLLESQMSENKKDAAWARKRIRELTKLNQEKII